MRASGVARRMVFCPTVPMIPFVLKLSTVLGKGALKVTVSPLMAVTVVLAGTFVPVKVMPTVIPKDAAGKVMVLPLPATNCELFRLGVLMNFNAGGVSGA